MQINKPEKIEKAEARAEAENPRSER